MNLGREKMIVKYRRLLSRNKIAKSYKDYLARSYSTSLTVQRRYQKKYLVNSFVLLHQMLGKHTLDNKIKPKEFIKGFLTEMKDRR